jgi:hypothetical protein
MKHMFKKLLGKGNLNDNSKPVEPIFPGTNFTIYKFDLPEGSALASINRAYDKYPNKIHFPWCVQLLLEIKEKNEKGHPTDNEAEVLNILEGRIERS